MGSFTGQQTTINSLASERGFRFINWNIRSLYNKFNELCVILDKLGCEVISLCETWLNRTIPDCWVTPPNYKLYRFDRMTKRRGGGLCVLIKNKYDCNSTKFEHLNICTKEIELLVLEICLPSRVPIILISCYRPPGENVDKALEILRSTLTEIPTKCELYVMGDLNLNYLCKGSPTFKKIMLMERTFQLTQYIVNPTRVATNSASLLDHIYTNSHLVSRSGTLNINLSDHYPCYIIRKKKKITHPTITFQCRKLKHLDKSFLRNRLEELNWRPFYDSTDPDTAWETFYHMLLDVIDKYYPITTFNDVPARAAWLNSDLF